VRPSITLRFTQSRAVGSGSGDIPALWPRRAWFPTELLRTTVLAVTDPHEPPNDGTRYLGSGLIRSGDQGILVRGVGRSVQSLLVALVRVARYVYDGLRRASSRRPSA